MKNMVKLALLFLLLPKVLIAEFILADGQDMPLDPKKMTIAQLTEVKAIYRDILLKYQWPMITMYFDELSQMDKKEYIGALGIEGGVELYLNQKIFEKYHNKYKAIFVPSSYVELAAMIAFAHQTFERPARRATETGGYRSAFPEEDVRNSKFARFTLRARLYESIFNALDKKSINSKSLTYLKIAFEDFNLRNEVYDLYIEASYYLMSYYGLHKLSNPRGIRAVIGKLMTDFLAVQDKLYSESEAKNFDLFDWRQIAKNPALISGDFDALVRSSDIEYGAFSKSEFALFRSIAPLDLDINIIESPYRELERNAKTFEPSTYSFGSSMLTGTFYENAMMHGARTLDYMRANKFGYALVFPIKDYLENNKGNKIFTLRDKYFIAPLCSISALFSAGELFHSRSKFSVLEDGKKVSGIRGTYERYISHIILLDLEKNAEFLVKRDTEWRYLAADITSDIGISSVFLHENSFKDSQRRKSNQDIIAKRILKVRPQEQIAAVNWPKAETIKQVVYSGKNPFFQIIQDPKKAKTKIYLNENHIVAFNDLRKRTKEHILIVPKEQYVSFSDFMAQATDDEIIDIFKGIANIARKKGLDKTGYRIVSNVSGYLRNDANQEVKHLHFHIAGGECLGMPVVKAGKSSKLSDFQAKLPGGSMLNDKAYIKYVLQNAIFIYTHKSSKFIAYKIENSFGIPSYIGFMIVSSKGSSVFKSIQDFSEHKSRKGKVMFLKFISAVANSLGLDETGYRIFSNHGQDALQLPKDVFQIFIAGGTALGPTVSNFYSNKSVTGKSADYEELLDQPHWHCPSSLARWHYFLSNAETISSKSFHDAFRKADKTYNVVKKDSITLSTSIAKFLPDIDPDGFTYAYITNLNKSVNNNISKLDKMFFGELGSKINAFLEQGRLLEPEFSTQARSVKEMLHFLEGSKQLMHPISAISPTISKHKDEWIFLDLDNTVTEGMYSAELNEKELPRILKEFQEAGGKVIALTNRYYWDNMDNDPKDLLSNSGQPMHKDTFKLLEKIGFKFSNPGELKEFLMGDPDKKGEESYKTPKFKDGVIFCSEQNMGTCLMTYLTKLFDSKIELPLIVDFYEYDKNSVEQVKEALKQNGVFGKLFLYNESLVRQYSPTLRLPGAIVTPLPIR